MKLSLQEQRRLCSVPDAVVSHDAMDAHFTEHIVRTMGGEMDDRVFASFSCFDTVEDPNAGPSEDYGERWLINWQRGPVLKGRYRVISEGTGVWIQEGCSEYTGEVLTDPTWEDLMVEAERMILCTGDTHHIFVEGVYLDPSPIEQLAAVGGDVVLDLHLCTGS